MSRPRRLAVNTGGGDAPGLNAVIRAVALSALRRGWEVVGIRRGYQGLIGPLNEGEEGLVPLDENAVRGITHEGGTILGTSNRGNPFEMPDGQGGTEDRSAEVVEAFRAHGLDSLIAIGGDGSLSIALQFHQRYGLPVIGVPKTIDNDLQATEVTFGFDTAVTTATDAIDKLHSTAESHERVMVVELMGRNAGWIALHAGIAGTADVILIPEIPFDMESVYAKIRRRESKGRHFCIVVVAEGAKPLGGERVLQEAKGPGHAARLGGIGDHVAELIRQNTNKETRSLTLGHLQRGGTPTAYDRLLSLRFGTAAVRLAEKREFGKMVALHAGEIVPVDLTEATQRQRTVPLGSGVLETARDLGICLGD